MESALPKFQDKLPYHMTNFYRNGKNLLSASKDIGNVSLNLFGKTKFGEKCEKWSR